MCVCCGLGSRQRIEIEECVCVCFGLGSCQGIEIRM